MGRMKRTAILLPLLVVASTVSIAQVQSSKISEAVRKHAPETIRMRERIHQYPELGNREVKTAEMVANHLRGLGIEVTTGVAHTGVIWDS